MNKFLIKNLTNSRKNQNLLKIINHNFCINLNENNKKISNQINSGLRKKKPQPKKFNPPEESLKMKIPEKEPETLNLKKFRYNNKLAEIKKEFKDFSQPAIIKENYASCYYRLNLNKEFDLLDLRNILYTYLFVRQRKGHIYLNINDYESKESPEEINSKVEEFLTLLDWLGIDLDFRVELKDMLFESQRKDEYLKYSKHLFHNKDAYKCFCKNYIKCEKDCYLSNENKDYNLKQDEIQLEGNSDSFYYLRIRNPDKNYVAFDYMKNEDIEFESKILGDFVIFKNFNKDFSEAYKRVIDDQIYGITHLLDNRKNFNMMKNEMLTRILFFKRKKYIGLPDVKIKYLAEKYYDNININYLKQRTFNPESLINEAYLLGVSKGPEKEYFDLINNNKDKDIIRPDKIMNNFDITKVNERGSVLDLSRLIYINKRLIQNKFMLAKMRMLNYEEMKKYYLATFPEHKIKIEKWDEISMEKICKLTSDSILTYEDIFYFYYLFEKPILNSITRENRRLIKMFFLEEETKKDIIKELNQLFNNIIEFSADDINREISYFVYRKYEKDKRMGNVNIYKLLKFIITGDSDSKNIGEICEYIGKTEVISRMKAAQLLTSNKLNENNKLFDEKKMKKRELISKINLDKVKLISEEIKAVEKKKINKSLSNLNKS